MPVQQAPSVLHDAPSWEQELPLDDDVLDELADVVDDDDVVVDDDDDDDVVDDELLVVVALLFPQ
jgi:hypothetical protein